MQFLSGDIEECMFFIYLLEVIAVTKQNVSDSGNLAFKHRQIATVDDSGDFCANFTQLSLEVL